MKIQSPPGMRDFYPEDMRVQNWLFDHWRGVSRAFGCQEYEGPIFESLDLYRLKSGDGIVSELFNFKDRGEREFAIRPEMTPTLARMVAARANALPRPIKWFSIPRMCRAERPQRGRLREFFQWNVDILGAPDDVLADAEVIAIAVESLKAVGLGSGDVVVRINNRKLASAMLGGLGIVGDATAKAFALIDRFEKLPPEEFDRQWDAEYAATAPAGRLRDLLTQKSFDECLKLAEAGFAAAGATAPENGDRQGGTVAEMRQLFDRLRDFGVAEFCEFDPGVVRGIAYYTGVVFETYTRAGSLRALQGGGRYDDLCSLLGGPKLSGIGFGMGDAPLLAALDELGKLPTLADQ
ncbi:MAG: ATP phosphoribosyltransferase regulatory subunit, partial [Phycisphaerae bacterium]